MQTNQAGSGVGE